MNGSSAVEALEQANDWLSKRLQLTEEQVREGEDVNITLTDENRQLKQVKATLTAKLQDLSDELDHLRASVHEYSYEKQSLLNNINSLEQQHHQYKQEEQNAKELVDELKYEVGKAQDVIASNTNDMENMKEYISELEHKNIQLQKKMVEQEVDNSNVIEAKEELLMQLQKTINDMESSQPMAIFINETGDRGDSFGLGDNDEEICHSSPATEVVSVEYLQHKLDDKDLSIKELEMRLESMQVANEIYQEELEGLRTRLEESKSPDVVNCNPGNMNSLPPTAKGTQLPLSDEDDSEMFEVVNDLLVPCQKIHQEDIITTAKDAPLTSIATQVDLDLRHLVTTASQSGVWASNDIGTQCEHNVPVAACVDNFTQHLLLTENKSTVSMTPPLVHEQFTQCGVPLAVAASQTEQLLRIDSNTQTEEEAWLKETSTTYGPENVVMPRQCDAVVECQLLCDSFTFISVDQFTQTSAPLDSVDCTHGPTCPTCLCVIQIRATNSVGVQTEDRQLPEDNLTVVLSDLRQSLKHTTAVIEDLEATTSGVFTATCGEDTLAARTSMSVSSFLNTEVQGKSGDGGSAHRGCQGRRGVSSTHSVSGSSSTTCSNMDEEGSCTYCARGGGRLLSQVASVAVICILVILMAVFFAMVGFGSYLTTLQRIGARRGLPPH